MSEGTLTLAVVILALLAAIVAVVIGGSLLGHFSLPI